MLQVAKAIVLLLVIVTGSEAQFSFGSLTKPITGVLSPITDSVKGEWDSFKSKYGESYSSATDEAKRLYDFSQSKNLIDEVNSLYKQGKQTFETAINKFSDLSFADFFALVGLRDLLYDPTKKQRDNWYTSPGNVQVPDEIDWRQKNVVSNVASQTDSCGSCWSFSATGAIESQHALKTGELIPLSKQNLIDCSMPYGTRGCKGGWLDDAFKYVRDNGIDSDDSYPYEAVNNTCRHDANTIVAKLVGYKNIEAGNEELLKEVVGTMGPVAVIMDASHPTLQHYKRGIYFEPECRTDKLQHAVLVVGYGTENGNDYWIVKNSWGSDWGEDGYFRIARNRNNHCGIASYAILPVL